MEQRVESVVQVLEQYMTATASLDQLTQTHVALLKAIDMTKANGYYDEDGDYQYLDDGEIEECLTLGFLSVAGRLSHNGDAHVRLILLLEQVYKGTPKGEHAQSSISNYNNVQRCLKNLPQILSDQACSLIPDGDNTARRQWMNKTAFLARCYARGLSRSKFGTNMVAWDLPQTGIQQILQNELRTDWDICGVAVWILYSGQILYDDMAFEVLIECQRDTTENTRVKNMEMWASWKSALRASAYNHRRGLETQDMAERAITLMESLEKICADGPSLEGGQ